MARSVFARSVELRHARSRRIERCEHRVVAEAPVTAWRIEDHTFPTPRTEHGMRVVGIAHESDHAPKPRAAGRRGDTLEGGEQFGDVRRVISGRTGVTRRIHPGRTAKRIDFEAGVVGHRRHAASRGGVARLEQRIVGESLSGLLSRFDAECALRDELQLERCEHLGELAHLAGIAGGQHHPHWATLTGPPSLSKRRRLQCVQLIDAAGGERQQRIEFVTTESVPFGRALDFDEPAAIAHHDVHVGLGLRVLRVIEIEHGDTAADANRHRSDLAMQGQVVEQTTPFQSVAGIDQRHVAAGNRRGARAAIGLQHVAIERHRTLTER